MCPSEVVLEIWPDQEGRRHVNCDTELCCLAIPVRLCSIGEQVIVHSWHMEVL